MLSDRPLIVPEIQGRSRDDPVEAHFPFENDHFRDLLDRPPLDTISNIYVKWGTIEDDAISTKNITHFLVVQIVIQKHDFYTKMCFLWKNELPKNALYFSENI